MLDLIMFFAFTAAVVNLLFEIVQPKPNKVNAVIALLCIAVCVAKIIIVGI